MGKKKPNEICHKTDQKAGREICPAILEDCMKSYLPLVAHFFSPARFLAPFPFRSGRFLMAAKRIASFSFRVSGVLKSYGFSASGAGAYPSSGGKSWIDHEDFIERPSGLQCLTK